MTEAGARKKRSELARAPSKLTYRPKPFVPEGVTEQQALKVLGVGAAIVAALAALGAPQFAALAVFGTAVIAYGVWRKRGVPRSYATLEVRKGVLEVRTGRIEGRAQHDEPRPRLTANVSDILEVVVEEDATSQVPLARICIVEKDRTTPLTDDYHPRPDSADWSKDVKAFLRSVGWVPAKERTETNAETEAAKNGAS